MPRDGSGIYHTPPGTDGVPDTTIDSAKYNTNVHDVETDLNTPRPIVAGGTGASDQAGALFNMSGEEAAQVVTNWDSMVWVPGSFYAASSATGTAPANGHAFAGICYINEPLANPPTNQNLVVEARDLDAALTVPVWLPNIIYAIGDSARDSADNSVWKATASNTSAASTFALARASMPGVWVAAPAIPVTQYVRIKKAGVWGAWSSNVPANSVRYDINQILTAAEQTQARKNIYAAPFDTMAYSGLQINGSMEVSQELGTTGTGTGGQYSLDGWKLARGGVPQITARQAASPMYGLTNILWIAVTTAQPTLTNSDAVNFYQPIEGYRTARLAFGTANAQSVTIGFWSAHHLTGIYSIAVQNGAGNRTYVATYTQNVADAPEYKTITVPGCLDGTWNVDNTVGMYVIFTVANGNTPAASVNSWIAGSTQPFASTQVNGVSSTANNFRITGVVVLPGIEAPSAARSALIMRPYDQELMTCMRYYQKSYAYGVAPGANTGAAGGIIDIGGAQTGAISALVQFMATMRAAPSINVWDAVGNSGKISLDGGATNNVAPSTLDNISEKRFKLFQSYGTSFSRVCFHYIADARL